MVLIQHHGKDPSAMKNTTPLKRMVISLFLLMLRGIRLNPSGMIRLTAAWERLLDPGQLPGIGTQVNVLCLLGAEWLLIHTSKHFFCAYLLNLDVWYNL